jgi:hypothetical protein
MCDHLIHLDILTNIVLKALHCDIPELIHKQLVKSIVALINCIVKCYCNSIITNRYNIDLTTVNNLIASYELTWLNNADAPIDCTSP